MDSLNLSYSHITKWLNQRGRSRDFSTTLDGSTNTVDSEVAVNMMNSLVGGLRTTNLTQARVEMNGVAVEVSTDLFPRTPES